jgi:hypothetical protein
MWWRCVRDLNFDHSAIRFLYWPRLPGCASSAEVGSQRRREALLALEKVFGRVQSAWAPAQGTETFEIIRRRLLRELDAEGEKAREQAVKAFNSYYKNNGPSAFMA